MLHQVEDRFGKLCRKTESDSSRIEARQEELIVKSSMNRDLEGKLTLSDVQKEFRYLVESQRQTALWFLNPSIPTDINHPQAVKILDYISQNCSGEIWLRVRRLKSWLLQHIK